MARLRGTLLPAVALVNGLIAAVIVYSLLAALPVVPSADAGDVLAYGHAIRGDVLPLRYPPLVPGLVSLLTIFTHDSMQSLRLAAAGAVVVTAASAYFMIRQFATPLLAATGSAFVAYAPATAEMLGWYGVPNLYAMAAGMMAIGFLAKDALQPSRGSILGFSFFASLTVGSHHLTAFYAATIGVFFTVLTWWAQRSFPRRLAIAGAVILILVLPYVPAYVGYITSATTAGTGSEQRFKTFYDGISYVHRTAAPLIVAGVVACFAYSTYRLSSNRDDGVARVMAAVAAAFVLDYYLLRTVQNLPARMPYFATIPALIGLAALLGSNPASFVGPRRLMTNPRILAPMAAVIFISLGFGPHLQSAYAYYSYQDDSDLEALLFVRDELPADAKYLPLTTGFEPGRALGYHYGWWIQGFAGKETMLSGSPFLLTFRDQIAEVEDATKVAAHGYTVDGGSLWYTLNLNRSSQNQIMHARFGAAHVETLFTSDASDVITFGGSAHRLFDAPVKFAALSEAEGRVELRTIFHWPQVDVVRTTVMEAGRHFSVEFQIAGTVPIEDFEAWMWASYAAPFQKVVDTDGGVLVGQTAGGETVETFTRYYGDFAMTGHAKDPKYGLPAIEYRAKGASVQLEGGFSIELSGGELTTPETTTPCEILHEHDVDYLYLRRDSPLASRNPGVDVFQNSKIMVRKPSCEAREDFLLRPSLHGFVLSPEEAHFVHALSREATPAVILQDPYALNTSFPGELTAALRLTHGAAIVMEDPRPPLGHRAAGDAASVLKAGGPAVWGNETALAVTGSSLWRQLILFSELDGRLREILTLDDADTFFRVNADGANWTLRLRDAPVVHGPVVLEQEGNLSLAHSFLWEEVAITRISGIEADGAVSLAYDVRALRPVTSADLWIGPSYGRTLQNITQHEGALSWNLGGADGFSANVEAVTGRARISAEEKPGESFESLRVQWGGRAAEWRLTILIRTDTAQPAAPRVLAPCDLVGSLGEPRVLIPAGSFLTSRMPADELGFWKDFVHWNPRCVSLPRWSDDFGRLV